MIKFYNTKMLSPSAEVPSEYPVAPEKGTYAYDKMGIEELKADFPENPDYTLFESMTENIITYFESDHPVETEQPDAEKQIIYNHDYILQVDPAESAWVREIKELLDADIRASVVQAFEESEGSIIEPTTDPVTPVPEVSD